MRSVVSKSLDSTQSCRSCSVALERSFVACRFCRKRYHLDCSELLQGCADETCEGHDDADAFDLVDRSPQVVPSPEPGKPWWVRHKEGVVYAGIGLGGMGLQSLDSLIPIPAMVQLVFFAALVLGAIAFTALSPSADD